MSTGSKVDPAIVDETTQINDTTPKTWGTYGKNIADYWVIPQLIFSIIVFIVSVVHLYLLFDPSSTEDKIYSKFFTFLCLIVSIICITLNSMFIHLVKNTPDKLFDYKFSGITSFISIVFQIIFLVMQFAV